MSTVDHLAISIENGTTPATDAGKQYASWLKGKDVPVEYEIAFTTHADFSKRVKLESLLIGDCPDDVLEKVLKFPLVSIQAYKELFFDLSVLHTDIDKLVFAENYYGKPVPAVDNMVLRGFNHGYMLLLLQYCNMVPTQAESIELLKRVFAGVIFKAASVSYTAMTSGIDKRAVDHCQLALKILEAMDNLKGDSEDNAASYVKFVSVLKDTGTVPKDFDPAKII